MNMYRDSQTSFGGVSVTPNIFTRLFDRCCELVQFSTAWTRAGADESWSAQPPAEEEGGPNVVYFH